jgi:phosphoribosyl 1,2-cyclic phosphodiesterase
VRFCSLGSGSEGNALLVEAGVSADGTSRVGGSSRAYRVLVDCGFRLKEIEARLAVVDLEARQIDAILVTHEHGDHIGGVYRLAQAHNIPVYLTHGTHRNGPASGKAQVQFIDPYKAVELPGLRVEPIAVPHDAAEPVQYLLDDGVSSLGVLTDLGHWTQHIADKLGRAESLILETNHDLELLANNPRYPEMLKRRISGQYGHLSNEQAGEILQALAGGSLKRVVGAHLSKANNRPDIAMKALTDAAQGQALEIFLADQANGFDWIAA